MKDILEKATLQIRPGWKTLMWFFVALGVIAFVVGMASGAAERTWQAYLINAVFWSGIAFAGVMLSVIWQITDAKWGRPFKRLAEGLGAYMPIGVLSLFIVFLGAGHLFEWVETPMHVKEGWLNLPFFVVRQVVLLGILLWFATSYVRNALRPDLAEAQRLVPGWGGAFAEKLLKNYGDHGTEVVRLEQRARRMAPGLGIVYAAVWSLVAFDFVMSLDQLWFSTLFGVYFFVGGLYTALAVLLIVVAFVREKPGLAEYMSINRFNDLAKLTFAIAMLWVYMVFTQFLVIWYSNLPEEAPYLVTRAIGPSPWTPLFWTLFFVLFIFPFLALMPKTICRMPKLVAVIAGILVVGQWWAHYLMVVPSIQDRHEMPHFTFGLPEILLTLGFGGLFFLHFFRFMSKVPILPLSDKHLCKTWHGH